MAAIFAFHTGKNVVRIVTIEIAINHLLDIRSPESVLPGEILVIEPDKGFKIVLYTAVKIGKPRVPWTINDGGSGKRDSRKAAPVSPLVLNLLFRLLI